MMSLKFISILIDPIITGYQEGGKRGEWGGGGWRRRLKNMFGHDDEC